MDDKKDNGASSSTSSIAKKWETFGGASTTVSAPRAKPALIRAGGGVGVKWEQPVASATLGGGSKNDTSPSADIDMDIGSVAKTTTLSSVTKSRPRKAGGTRKRSTKMYNMKRTADPLTETKSMPVERERAPSLSVKKAPDRAHSFDTASTLGDEPGHEPMVKRLVSDAGGIGGLMANHLAGGGLKPSAKRMSATSPRSGSALRLPGGVSPSSGGVKGNVFGGGGTSSLSMPPKRPPPPGTAGGESFAKKQNSPRAAARPVTISLAKGIVKPPGQGFPTAKRW